jgi:hypothetical protein
MQELLTLQGNQHLQLAKTSSAVNNPIHKVLHAILEDCWVTAIKVGKRWSSLSEELVMEWRSANSTGNSSFR